MSLIASTFSQELPFILGDLLFTSKEGKPDFISPTQFPFSLYPEKQSERKPLELMQKIYILKDNLALALAGDYYEIKNFLTELKLRLAYYDEIDKGKIVQFLNDFDLEKNFSKSAMMILLVLPQDSDSDYVNRFYCGDWHKELDDNFGSVWAIGSGSGSFLKQFKEPVIYNTELTPGNIQYCITANLGLLAKWLAIEKGSGLTFENHWGGGFEMVYFDGQKFVKFQEICFVIFEGQSDSNGIIEAVFPSVIMFLQYEGDILFITSLKLLKGTYTENESSVSYVSENGEVTLFVVTPIDLPDGTVIQQKKNLSFETSQIAAGYSILMDGNGFYQPSFYMHDDDFNVKFIYGESVEIKIPTQINQQILSGGKDTFDFERNK